MKVHQMCWQNMKLFTCTTSWWCCLYENVIMFALKLKAFHFLQTDEAFIPRYPSQWVGQYLLVSCFFLFIERLFERNGRFFYFSLISCALLHKKKFLLWWKHTRCIETYDIIHMHYQLMILRVSKNFRRIRFKT